MDKKLPWCGGQSVELMGLLQNNVAAKLFKFYLCTQELE